MANVNLVKLRELSNTNPQAKVVFSTLSGHIRPWDVTDLRRLYQRISKEGHAVDRDTFRKVFETLAKHGMGVYVKGRDIQPDRFKWNFNYIEWSRRILGKEAASSKVSPQLTFEGAASPKAPSGWMTVAYPLRDEVLQLSLPTNLSKKEAEELASFIRRFGR